MFSRNLSVAFTSAFTTSKREDQWCEKSSANTSVDYTTGNCYVDLSVASGAAQNASTMRRTRNYFGTQRAKSSAFYTSAVLNAVDGAAQQTGITARIGVFDASNGVFFELADDTLYIVKRNAGTDTRVAQGVWNMNRLQSMGGFNVNRRNIYFFKLDPLNAGDVTLGIILENQEVECHVFRHTNVGDTDTEAQFPYMSASALPITHELLKTGSGAESGTSRLFTCNCLCEDTRLDFNTTPVSYIRSYPDSELEVRHTPESLIAYRVKSSASHVSLVPEKFTFINTRGSAPLKYAALLYRAPLAHGSGPLTGASWTALSAAPASEQFYSYQSVVEYDVSATAIDISGSTYPYVMLDSGYFTDDAVLDVKVLRTFRTGTDIDGNTDWLVLVIHHTTNTSRKEYIHGGMQWRELNV